MELMTKIKAAMEGGAPIRGERTLEYDDPDGWSVDILTDIRRDKWSHANKTIAEGVMARRLKNDAPVGSDKPAEGGEPSTGDTVE